MVHVVYRFDVGGLENGVVNLINRLPRARYRHAVVALTEVTEFRRRIRRDDVAFHALGKREGQDWGLYRRLWRLFRTLRPALVHTRNVATLEAQIPAFLAGVPCRVHGEHGWDVHDLDGRRYARLRRWVSLLVHRHVALSLQIRAYLHDVVGLPEDAVEQIYNGVDLERFSPQGPVAALPADRDWAGAFVVGWVGRMEAVKNPLGLVRAFLHLRAADAELGRRLRLVMVGDGPLRTEAERLLREAGADGAAWLPGRRDDIPELMRRFHLFVLPSLAEGVCNTVLEAMACGVPVVATAVGGNRELVADRAAGALVPPGDEIALADAIAAYVRDPVLRRIHGAIARRMTEHRFGIEAMVQAYDRLYAGLLARRGLALAG
ncbi:TIGR03088 family PEP-CTERM/XrtA system glycosyltransferase [Inmirania thermothiophila]|uniref:TIGR03088 family PEP-CTERM/XrtA system glycosyltransferase n=1 Tax=Inmirania thermothiophila TaxID=1750597 RepID=UPI000F4AE5B8|nr:TIGR03088 family PEP-CTERM/XrtA system glycosyltransferase [Inmirania thermothiophila]